MATRKSVAQKVLVPVLLLTAMTFAAVLALTSRVTSRVREDYDRLTLAGAAAQVDSILELAVAELTAAKLSDNPVVQQAKRGAVVDSVRGFWTRAGLQGLIVDSNEELVASTLEPHAARQLVAVRQPGFFLAEVAGEHFRCLAEPFAPWGWTVITVGQRPPLEEMRPELASLFPLLVVSALALVGGVLLLLWHNVQTPVARMVADVGADVEVRSSGVEELDQIGAAVNTAMARLRARTSELAAELDRRHETEQALRDRDVYIRLLLDSAAEGIFGLDTKGTCTFCNPAALRMLGYASDEEILGKDVHQMLHHSRPDGGHYSAGDCPVVQTSRKGEAARVVGDVFWRKDGEGFPVEFWSCPVVKDGVLTGAVVGFVDITERTTLEEQLRQAQKMEAVGRLAGGIAHDFNNMLMAIIGHASLAREGLEEGSATQTDVDQVLLAAEKAAGLTRQLLAFSRRRSIKPAPVDLNEIVQGMGKVLTRLIGADVEVVYRLASGGLVAMADRAQLEQILLNLWTNARDAMPDGGNLVVATEAEELGAAAAAELGLEAPGRYAVLSVADDGVGMDVETRKRIFEPFFTTKDQGKGTGLGLSIAYGIVRQHHGLITVESAPGRGSTFRVYLPLTGSAASARPRPTAVNELRGGNETVLLAEDDDQVRALVRAVLEGAGYRVLPSRDGAEAVTLHEACADEIGLCLFDVVMPRLGGREALRRIRERSGAVRALLMSGNSPDAGGHDSGEPVVLPKPVVPGELLRRVREALDAPAA